MKTNLKTSRLDENRVLISSNKGFDITLFANKDVLVDKNSLLETINLMGIHETIENLNKNDFFGDYNGSLENIILTPDFHKGAGIPVGTVMDAQGFVLPKAIGGDISCGMRLVSTNITKDEFDSIPKLLDNELRYIFFEGGRNIPMTTKCREGILRYGIPGLEEIQNTGIWKHINLKQVLKDIDKINNNGSMKTNDLWNFHDYVKGSGESGRDSEIATIGGGNHFIEIQYVEECIDKKTSYDWNLKKGHITIMVHTGSIGFGTSVGQYFIDLAKKIYPKILEKQEHGFYPLPTVGPLKEKGLQYLSAMGLAANFAFVNRLMLSELVLQCLSKFVKKEIISTLVYDSPHNLIWSENNNISNLHRKGATPAEKFECNEIFPDGHPVIVPGSMGDFSYVLKGNGNCSSLCSASHGAGRKSARGEARKANNNDLDTIRVITKIDFKNVRKDVANEVIKNLLEEAPNNYKDIIPAIETLKNSDIAYPVAKLSPLLTIKG